VIAGRVPAHPPPADRATVRRIAGAVAAAATLLAGIAAPAVHAQGRGPGGYPAKPVRLVTAGVPGGTTDIVARVVSPRWAEELGQTVLIDNRAGAAGLIARDVVARAAPDGYTLLMTNQAIVFAAALHPAGAEGLARDFAAVAWLGVSPNMLVANTALPARTVGELVSLLRSREVGYASGGVGSSTHVAMELFLRTTGARALHVPYKSAGAGITDVVAGHVHFMISTLPAALPYVRNGKLRAIALTGAQRSPALRDLPTLAEVGVRGYLFDTWYGIFGPASLPVANVNWINGTVNRSLADGTLRERLGESGVDAGTGTPEFFRRMVREDVSRWTRAMKDIGIRPE
jgi:tripartite-type tricarboxylate transporter receptor subunit TctC